MGLEPVLAYRIDHHRAMPGVDRCEVERLEDELFAAADLVAYSSSALLSAERDRHRGAGRHLDHGVDAVRFDPDRPGLDEPADLAAVPRPRLGLVGSLEAATKDVELLDAIATALPEVSVVVVGAEPDAAPTLAAHPNVWMLGRRPHAAIPRYLRHLDAGLVLVPDHEWGRGSNPIKLKEYLAMGLAVVSTDFPELERYRGVVAVGTDADAIVEAVRGVLTDPVRREDDAEARARRRAVGAARTWQDQAVLLLRWWDDDDAADDLAALGPLDAVV
jgi:glycosyltransferase involved in cell wall biosynthesis